MTFKDFIALRDSKTPEEFAEWFDRTANWYIDVCGEKIICAKASNRKALLRDGSVVEVDAEEKIKMLSDDLRQQFRREREHVDRYLNLSLESLYEVNKLTKRLWEKEEAERKQLKNAVCSFCGATKDEVNKMIACPNRLCICDACIKEYYGHLD